MKDYNDHWRPFWIHCQICSNQFDIIGKFETIKEDAEVIKGERQPLALGPPHMQKVHEFAQMYFLRNKLFVGTILIKNGTISMKVGTIAVR